MLTNSYVGTIGGNPNDYVAFGGGPGTIGGFDGVQSPRQPMTLNYPPQPAIKPPHSITAAISVRSTIPDYPRRQRERQHPPPAAAAAASAVPRAELSMRKALTARELGIACNGTQKWVALPPDMKDRTMTVVWWKPTWWYLWRGQMQVGFVTRPMEARRVAEAAAGRSSSSSGSEQAAREAYAGGGARVFRAGSVCEEGGSGEGKGDNAGNGEVAYCVNAEESKL